ncbi:hypothetical protein [Rosenbergiella australiborealis]|uniref:hypothetical protein n=1 Tax=Rosenbergiella australiborealis TaxID=1544696 RepID=UPI001F4E184E|nr:hypothetical protein [Rosenbergiella australiborealis]
MKLLLKLLLSLILLFLILISLGYGILRSQWGIAAACRWISDATAYHLSIERFTHSWSHPLTFELDNMTFGEDGQPALLITDKLSFSLIARQLLTPSHFGQITIKQGSLVLSNLTPEATLPFSADRLELQAVKLLNPYPTNCLSAKKIDGVVIPWQPSQQAVLGKKFTFNFSAENVHVGGRQFDKLIAQGDKDHQILTIHHLSGAVDRGTFEGQLERSAEGVWQIPYLALDNIRFQTEKPFVDMITQQLSTDVTIKQLRVNHLSIVGPDWVINDLSAEGINLRNSTPPEGKLSLNAGSLILGTEEWSQPHLSLTGSGGNLHIDRFTAGWAKGTVSAEGEWQEKERHLLLNQLVFSNIHYVLPSAWQAFLQEKLPSFIDTITLNTLRVDNGLLIDITPDFPFQMTATHITGNHLQIAQHHQWGIWGGDAEYYAATTTFNRQDVRALWFKIKANSDSLKLQEIKALIGDGPVIGDVDIAQSSPRSFSLSLRGEKVPYSAFNHWFWQHPLQGTGNFDLKLEGNFSLADGVKSAQGTFTTPTFTQKKVP